MVKSISLTAAIVAGFAASPALAASPEGSVVDGSVAPGFAASMEDYREKTPGEKYGAEWAVPGEKTTSRRDLQARVTAYGWLSQSTGSVSVGGTKADADMSFNDILDNLVGAWAGRVTIEGQRWGAYADLFVAHLGHDFDTPVGPADIDLRMKFYEGAATWRVLGDRSTAQQAHRASLTAYGGLRYSALETNADVPNLGISIHDRTSWIDPIIGLSGNVPLAKKLDLFAAFDAGGFGVGSRMTWNGLAGLTYHVSETVHMVAGYRVMKIDYVDGNGADRVHLKMRLDGPFAGITIWF